MPPKGSKKAFGGKKGVKKVVVPTKPVKEKFWQTNIKKTPTPTQNDNEFIMGSKEANWALLKASGTWFTMLDDRDIKEAEEKGMAFDTPPFHLLVLTINPGVIPGSNEWVNVSFPPLLLRKGVIF